MGQSLSNVLIHVVFSTKRRTPWLADPWRGDLHEYLTGIVKDVKSDVIAVNSVADHVHVLLTLPRDVTIATIMMKIKSGTSGWIHKHHPKLATFQWQSGYGVFSISPSHKGAVVEYIHGQEEHHKKVSFQDEFRRLLNKYEITYDEAYVWD